MKSCLTWLGALLFSAVALGDAACGISTCTTTPFCRWFDLATLCKEGSACTLPAGMTIFPSDMAGDKSLFGQGHFEQVSSTDSITIPLSGAADVRAAEPVLEVALHLRTGPLARDGITITADGQPVACSDVVREGGASDIALDCPLPIGAKEVKFEYIVTSANADQGIVSFDLEMFLHEREGFCTGAVKTCAL
jgi:hypothetical protein